MEEQKTFQNSVVIDNYTADSFAKTCEMIDDLHTHVFQGYMGEETSKAEAWAEHLYCEFVLAYLDLVVKQLKVIHDIQLEKK